MNALLGLYDDVVDEQALSRSIDRFREKGILLPTFAQLADPRQIDPSLTAGISADAADPANLFRVHWHNDASRTGRVDMPDYLEVPSALTGVE
ncbi:MAG: pyridoxal-5'-phosphate-dependent protein subunit beta, partial [Actinomycetota bacterium]|nr:pyridoxal-5'-phosphate-dependent protein subunit beta [Actinomycetota bacterium]